MKENPKISNFLQDILFMSEDKGEIVISLRKLILEIAPDAKQEIKYGGLVFLLIVDLYAESLLGRIIYLLNLLMEQKCKTLKISWKVEENTDGT